MGLQKNAFLSGVKNLASKKVLRTLDNKIFNSIKEAFDDSNIEIKCSTFYKKLKNNKIENYKIV